MTGKKKISVLVVEDSSVAQMLLVQLLNSDPRIEVIGAAANGREALQFLERQSPDVILMDVHMPEMDGFEATRRIMETRPVPIVICSGSTPREALTTFRLMDAGAVAIVEKPRGMEDGNLDSMAAELLQTVKLMSEVKVIRRWPRKTGAPGAALSPTRRRPDVELVGIGASTGGPPVIQTILTALPKAFPVPILIVQHIIPGFLQGLADWLNQTSGFKVHIAAHGVRPLPGHVYLAPDDFHMKIRASGEIELTRESPHNNLRPSVGRLFASLAEHCGPVAIGVLLSGMGRDGAAELRKMKDRGAFTIVQNRESSVVHGMPGEAIALDAATAVMAPDQIAAALVAQVEKKMVREGEP